MKNETKNLTLKSLGMFIAVAGISLFIFSSCSQKNNDARKVVTTNNTDQNITNGEEVKADAKSDEKADAATSENDIAETNVNEADEDAAEIKSEEQLEAQALKDTSTDPVTKNLTAGISAEIMAALQAKREIIRKWAPLCADGTQTHYLCPEGDMTIFSGIACLAGEKERCEDVRKAQGPDGRWWRSPGFVGQDQLPDTFSRDQARGALAYLVATKDVEAAKRWQAYIESNDGKMCNVAMKTNNRCTITPGSSRLFRAVWLYLGLTPAKWMKKTQWYVPIYDPIEAMLQPDNFPMHLSGLFAWIRIEIERRGGPAKDKVDRKVIKIITRREPGNPFFKMLRDGPTEEVAQLILQKCPDTKPVGPRLDWSWQRSQKLKKGQTEYVWQHASGHDSIFIVNMFERELALKNGAPALPQPMADNTEAALTE